MAPTYSLRAITGLVPGDHLCCLYETEEEHRAVLTPYLRQGLERGEKVLHIVDARTAEAVLIYLREDGLEVEAYLARGQLCILTRDDAYMRQGVFDPDGMIALLRSETARALAEGYTALRTSGEMTWALRGLPGSGRLIEYEAELNNFFPGSQCLGLCQYDRRRFDPAVLLEVLATHPTTVVGTAVYDNFYYLPPQDLLGTDRPAATLRHWLENLAARKRTEEALRKSEERFRIIARATNDAVWDWDLVRNEVLWNEGVRALFGYSAGEVGGDVTWWYEHIHPQEREKVVSGIHAVIEGGGQFWSDEYRYRRADGSYAYVFDRGYVIHDDKGKPVRMIGAMIDITERKRAEEALRQSEQHFRLLYEESPVAYHSLDAEGRFLEVNEAWLKLLGYGRDEVVGHWFRDFFVPSEVDLFRERFSRFKAAGEIRGAECNLVHKDGSLITVSIDGRIARDETGAFKRTHCVLHNITERKRAEEALRESEAQLRELYDEAPVGYHELDGEGRLRRVNRTELAMLGYTAEEMIGRPVWEFVLEREAAHRAVLAKLAGSNVVPAFERTYLRKDGTQVPVLIEDRLLRDAEGRVTGIRSTIQDISVRKQAQEAARENQRVLEAVLETTRALIVLADSEGRILLFNRACEELTGYSRQKVLGKPIADCFPDQAWVSIALKLLVDREGPGLLVPHECPWQTASGEQRLIEWCFRVFPSPRDGRPCVLGTGIDITARKRAEEEIRRLARFPSENPNPILRVSQDGRILYANESSGPLLAVWGCAGGDLVPLPWCETVRESLASQSSGLVDVQCSERIYSLFVVPVPEAGYVNLYGRDITERKQAEEALRRSEENFRRSLDDSPLGVRIVTIEGETIYANRAILEIYGLDSIEELRTTPVKKRYTPESYAGFQIRKKKRHRGEYAPPDYEISIVRKNGEVRHLQVFRKEILWDGEKQFQVTAVPTLIE